MTRLLLILVIVLLPNVALADCQRVTIVVDGKLVSCQQCCWAGHCTVTCL